MDDQESMSVNQELDENISENTKIPVTECMENVYVEVSVTPMDSAECNPRQESPTNVAPDSDPVIEDSVHEKETNKEETNEEETNKEETNDTKTVIISDRNQHLRANELDKFKRRMIRAIARLMLVEKKPEEEVWEDLKKETGCDCKLLWTRMRALTIKKLKRLFDANDRNDNVTKIAQLSVTDWLLFDLTLVHEDIDVIGQNAPTVEDKKEENILEDLFQLVVKYYIEYVSGDRLTMAWHDLTTEYNSRGRKCSAMLLQRRWYQFKQQIRLKFYKFWFEFRGSIKNLKNAEKFKPTNLEVDIVRVFMFIVTDPLQTWEQLIEEKRVSLLSDFERLLLPKQTSKSNDEPDVLVIEPQVETIDLGIESDEDTKDSSDLDKDNNERNEESYNDDRNDENDGPIVAKTESVYDLCGEDEVRILELTHIPLESNANLPKNETDEPLEAASLEEDMLKGQKQEAVEDTTDVAQSNYDEANHDCAENELDLIVEEDDVVNTEHVHDDDFEIVMPKITNIISAAQIEEINDIDYEATNEINYVEEQNTDKDSESNNVTSETEKELLDINTEIIAKDDTTKESSLYTDDASKDLCFTDRFELEDDGIEYIDEEHVKELNVEETAVADDYTNNEDEEYTSKIDQKLLLDPVVYTKKLDHMDVFRFINYATVKDGRIIENAAIESRPFDIKSVKIDSISEECQDIPANNVIHHKSSGINNTNEYETIKSTSWLFRKPRAMTYNPIKLCKNPDFNTRLKRLTVGFFASQRNRQLFKKCKPLTVDVHKAFESKLINNCLYLEKCFFFEAKNSDTINAVEKTVLPSELPGQKLNYNVQDSISASSSSKLKPKDESTPEANTVERHRVINLPDFDQIRRQNKNILVAEVSPLQTINVTGNPPVANIDKEEIIEQNSQNNNKIANCNNDNVSNLNKEQVGTTGPGRRKKSHNPLTNRKPNLKGRNFSETTWLSRMNAVIDDSTHDDRLLAPDTVQRIINVCKGINNVLTKKQNNAKRKNLYRTLFNAGKQRICGDYKTIIPVQKDQENPFEKQQENVGQRVATDSVPTEDNQSDITVMSNCLGGTEINNVRVITKNVRNSSCCWAREKLLFWKKKIKWVCRHLCPRDKCICCCNQIYCAQLKQRRKLKKLKVSSFCSLISDDESEHDPKKGREVQNLYQIKKDISAKVSHTVVKRFNIGTKVDVGVNTDFDKDFEESYAANISNSNILSSFTANPPIITTITSLDEKGSNSHSTQTFSCTKDNLNSAIKSVSTSDIINNKKQSHVNSDIESKLNCNSVQPSPLQNLKIIKKVYTPKELAPKCRTKICTTPSFTPIAPKVLNTKTDPLLTNEPNNLIIKQKELKTNLSKKPICLGKNKILLCSLQPLKKTDMIDVTHLVKNMKSKMSTGDINDHSPDLIPKGVHFVLMPNRELVLSFDPGVELLPSQIAHLPTILNLVQRELYAIQANNKLSHTGKKTTSDIIQLSDEETSNANDSQDSISLENNEQKHVQISNIKQDISYNKIIKADSCSIACSNDDNAENVATSECLSDAPINELVNNSEDIPQIDDKKPDNGVIEEVEEQHETPISIDAISDNVDLDSGKKDLKDTTNLSKKTIISDLMEMSGISLEDTAVTNNDNSIGQSPSLQLTPEVQETSNASTLLVSCTSDGNDSIDLIQNNPFVKAALTKCPELLIVYSFDDLKYAYENKGQFYKMDIENGIIVPINVCIKKRINCKKIKFKDLPKSVIDLTEDDKTVDETSTPESIFIESTAEKSGVKPIKMFKSVHPSILRHNFKTLSMQQGPIKFNRNLLKKKVQKVLERKKRTDNKNLESYVKISTKRRNEPENYTDSESDNEPLSLKAKRIRTIPVNLSENIDKVTSPKENSQPEDDQPPHKKTNEDKYHEAPPYGPPMVIENQQEDIDAIPLPLIFQCNNNESSEEDCILGV